MNNDDVTEYFGKRILLVASVGLLLACLSVALISVLPLYKQLKKQRAEYLIFAVRTRSMVVDEFLTKARETARQITSRSKVRQALEKYDNHEIDLTSLQTFSTPLLRDAINLSGFAVGITQLDRNGSPVIKVGLSIPRKFLFQPSIVAIKPMLNGPIKINNKLYIIVRASILNRKNIRLGTDVVLFTLSDLRNMVQDYTGLGKSGEIILGRIKRDGRTDIFFPTRPEPLPNQMLQARHIEFAMAALKNPAKPDSVTAVHLQDSKYELAAYASIKGANWRIVVRMNKDELFEAVTRQVLLIILIISGVVIPLCIIGLAFLLRPLSNRMLLQVDALQREISAKKTAIHERALVEQELLNETSRLDLTLRSIGDGVITTDLEYRIVMINKVAEQLTGWQQNEAIGKLIQDVFILINRETREACENPVQNVITSGQISSLDNHTLLIGKDGSEHEIADSGAPIVGEKGEIHGAILVFRDVTQQNQTEEALRRSQKMDAIGKLSGGIAHDFNNQLGIVIGYLDFLKTFTANDEKPKQWVEIASKATLRCMDLTRQLLAFARRQTEGKSSVNINAALREMETMIARSVTPEVDVQYYLADDLWLTEIDPGEFQDAMLNLVFNSRDAMSTGGKILIETTNSYLDADFARLNPGVEPGNYVKLVMSDTGLGMNKETLEHVFEPFFTTKPEGKGTGLGMAMVYGFVTRYGGNIKMYSEVQVGTSIRIYLPRCEDASFVEVTGSDSQSELPTGNESILIVDDEVELLQLAELYLQGLGYQTQTADDATRALEILKKEKNIALLFSDVVMPGGMTGFDLAHQATKIIPGIKILLSSGFTSKAIKQHNEDQIPFHLLGKPYRKHDLARRVRLVLDSHPMTDKEPEPVAKSNIDSSDQRVMVVDDDEDVRDLLHIHLKKLGYETVFAQNADEAVTLYRQSIEEAMPIDVVILDLTLPGGMGGKELAEKLRSLDPHAKLIVSSGDSFCPEMTDYQNYGFSGALEKDYNSENIKRILETVITRHSE